MNKKNLKQLVTKRNIQILGCIILAAFIIVYGSISTLKYFENLDALAKNETLVQNLQSELITSSESFDSEQTNFKDLKSQIDQGVDKILPNAAGTEELVRELDNLERLLNREGNNFFVSNVSFGAIEDFDSNVSLLPVSISINSSRENFLRFLDYIENSGSVNNPNRLMEIDNISVNFSESLEGSPASATITVNINAYYQKQNQQ